MSDNFSPGLMPARVRSKNRRPLANFRVVGYAEAIVGEILPNSRLSAHLTDSVRGAAHLPGVNEISPNLVSLVIDKWVEQWLGYDSLWCQTAELPELGNHVRLIEVTQLDC